MTQTFIHNIHPSFADEQKRRSVMASLGGKPFKFEVEKAIRPLRAEAALMEKEQIANAHYAATEDFSDVDLNAMMEE